MSSPYLPLAQLVTPTTSAAPSTTAPAALESSSISTTTATTGPAATAPAPKSFMDSLPGLLLPGIMLVVLYFVLFRGKGKGDKKYSKMLQELKRGDRVQTIGGMIGSIVEVKGDEVVIKVDESNNVKIRYIKNAIAKVLDDDKAEEKK